MDARGTILCASPGVATLLRIAPHEAIGRLFSRLPGLSVPASALKLENAASAYELSLRTQGGDCFTATVIPVRRERTLAGFLALLADKRGATRKVKAGGLWQASYTFADIVGESASLRACLAEARRLAQQDFPVLLRGESGTGKELFAQAIHNASRRQGGPFVPLNCGGLNDELLGAELFGYAEGAFTGAVRGGKAGKLELADQGTLFLDEVEEMSPKMQAHLLRVLEEGRVVRLGADKPRPIDVRIIAATNADLEARIREGRFRLDLYYRLNVLSLVLPPLRERREDIPLLAAHVLASQGIPTELSPAALARLQAYCWPGNVRQLRNVVLQAANRAAGALITEVPLPATMCPIACGPLICPVAESPARHVASPVAQYPAPHGTALQRAEREVILQALKDCGGNISRAASRLGLHRATLYRKMDRYGIKTERAWR